MMLSDWKRKNSFMTISLGQIKGLIAVCLTLAIIPFIIFLYSLFHSYQVPEYSDQSDNALAVEVVENDQPKGIYFVDSETSSAQLLKAAGIGEFFFPVFKLNDGIKITVDSSFGKNDIVVTRIANAERMSLGMPIDINKATEDDLLLVKGIGDATAQKILDLRNQLGRFEDVNQLMQIKGIKEKKLTEIRKYLYVEKSQM
jgi:competence protein ComEA